MPYRLITAYTPEYEAEAHELFKTTEPLGLRLNEYPYQSLGSWEKNTHRTVEIIKAALTLFDPDPVVWIDADARFFKYPSLFDTITADIGVHKRSNPNMKGWHYNSGTIFYANRPAVHRFLDDQIARLKAYRDTGTGQPPHTNWMLRNTAHGLNIFELPLEYSYIEGTEREDEQIPFGRVVIMHTQASRRMRSKIR